MTKATNRDASSAVDSSSTDRAVTLEDFSVNAMNAAADAAVGLGFVKIIILAVGELSESNAGLAKQLAEAGHYWAEHLELGVMAFQDEIDQMREGGAA